MVLRRCAWHGLYYGYRLVYGVASWRGRGIGFSDGLCSRCAVSLSNDLPTEGRPRRSWRAPGMAPEVSAALCLIAMVTAAVAVRPLEPPSVPGRQADAPLVRFAEASSRPLPTPSRPAAEAIRRLFTPKADVEVAPGPSPDAAPAAPPALAFTPWVARPRPDLVVMPPVSEETPRPPSRALLALYDDPTAARALGSVQTP